MKPLVNKFIMIICLSRGSVFFSMSTISLHNNAMFKRLRQTKLSVCEDHLEAKHVTVYENSARPFSSQSYKKTDSSSYRGHVSLLTRYDKHTENALI